MEVRQIDEKGRVAADGRIKVGDCIVEINGRPVYQVSDSKFIFIDCKNHY